MAVAADDRPIFCLGTRCRNILHPQGGGAREWRLLHGNLLIQWKLPSLAHQLLSLLTQEFNPRRQ
jgi:hypothetical protein